MGAPRALDFYPGPFMKRDDIYFGHALSPASTGVGVQPELVAVAGPLPSPKGVALEIMRLTRRDDVTVLQIAQALSADPALSGRLIKTANSVSNGASRPVASIKDAVTVLGLATVRQLALGFSLLSNYGSGACAGFDYRGFWSKSLLAALAAQGIARQTRTAAPDEMFACGLLSDVGRLAFATMYPVAYSALIEEAAVNEEDDLCPREIERFGLTHVEMSAMMLHDWGLPELFVDAIRALPAPRRSHDGISERVRVIQGSLMLARALAGFCLSDGVHRHQQLPVLLADAGRMGIDAETMSTLAADIAAQWREWGQVLNVMTVEAGDLVRELRQCGNGPDCGDEQAKAESPLRILVADADPAVRAALQVTLEAAGHRVQLVADGNEALGAALEFRPQVLITDSMAPVMDGCALCRALRETELGRNLYVFMLSESGGDADLDEAFSAGVDDFISKPLVPRILLARLRGARRVLEQQQQMAFDVRNIRTLAAELASKNQLLQQAAATDPLTALPNRRYMMERLLQAWASSVRRQAPLSCIAIDLDHFKRINDALGHAAGDAALRHAAGILRGEARLQDLVCRTGGEEFLVICPDIGLDEARLCAERLRQSVAASVFTYGEGGMPMTLSAGVACKISGIDDVESLLREADRALYRAKTTGRDRVMVAAKP